eukprot:TRINITY_DN1632_c0_g1_i2.p1 TRINITY_DN1632_c0_g1~~TRINITY_DN1632_c0_g1_i2.p1  ORF type:complete len:255 (-),score=59.40 TRINITY_DN1632_c0_g1_i2:110-874(-)
MKILKIVLVVLISISCVQGKKKNKLKYDKKDMTSCSGKMDTIKPQIAKLRADLDLIHKCMNTSRTDPNWSTYCVEPPASFSSTGNQVPSGRMQEVEAPKDRSTAATTANTFAIGDMYLSGYSTKCGPQTITGWTNSLDIYYSTTVATDSTTTYVSTGSGTYTAPVNGYYNICAFLRFKKGGNAVDVTVYAGGSVVAGFGDAVDADWRSTGTCIIRLLTAGNTVYIRNNSGGGSDCVEETAWRYGRLGVYMVGPT